MASRDLLLEIGTEEIPARFMPDTIKHLTQYIEQEFNDSHIEYASVDVKGTPRRIVLMVQGLSEVQNDIVEKFKGPLKTQAFDENGEMTRAALGFAKGKGVSTEDLTVDTVKGVEYIFAERHEKGKDTAELLPVILKTIVSKLSFPKSMFWSEKNIRFARPVRWIVALFGDDVVDFTFAKIKSGRVSRGHRFLGASAIEITNMESYLNEMKNNFVVIDPEERRRMILAGISEIEEELNAKVDVPETLLEENVHLNEYPIPFYGSFDEEFLEIPEEVLTLSMAVNQRYFPVRNVAGRLMPNFVGVSNNKATDMSIVREGNERVLRARLYDAAFFWKEDLQVSLDKRVESLKNVTYQEQLGSVYEKVSRVQNLAIELTRLLGHNELENTVARAAYLAKADLVTNMVNEFSDVQGVMGREYARKSGEPEEVALALYEQYLPKAAGQDLPTQIPGAILGIAERADTIAGIYKIGLEPTSSQDPYGLRRAARGIIELIWGLGLEINIRDMFRFAGTSLNLSEEVYEKIITFINQRMQVRLKEKGYKHEVVVLSMQTISELPLEVLRMCETLEKSYDEPWFGELITSAVRVNNILVKNDVDATEIDESKLVEEAEKALYNKLNELTENVKDSVAAYNWERLASLLSELSPVIAAFFNDVLVMDKDESIKNNRIALLKKCRVLFLYVGDFSLLK